MTESDFHQLLDSHAGKSRRFSIYTSASRILLGVDVDCNEPPTLPREVSNSYEIELDYDRQTTTSAQLEVAKLDEWLLDWRRGQNNKQAGPAPQPSPPPPPSTATPLERLRHYKAEMAKLELEHRRRFYQVAPKLRAACLAIAEWAATETTILHHRDRFTAAMQQVHEALAAAEAPPSPEVYAEQLRRSLPGSMVVPDPDPAPCIRIGTFDPTNKKQLTIEITPEEIQLIRNLHDRVAAAQTTPLTHKDA